MAKYFIYFFAILLAVSEITGLLFMGATVALCVRFWRPNPTFAHDVVLNKSLHMFLSTLGGVFLTANGVALFRVLRNYRTSVVKYLHTFFLGVTLLITIWGAWCGIKQVLYRKTTERNHFADLHGILGLVSTVIFIVQYATGGVLYLTNALTAELAEDLTGLHGFVGVAIVLLNGLTTLTGLSITANCAPNFDVINRTERFVEANYSNFTYEFQLVFAAGIFMTIFSWNFFYITVNPYFEWTMVERY